MNRTTSIDSKGRIKLPIDWLEKAGVELPSELLMSVTEEGGLLLETREQSRRRAQASVRKHIPEGVSLSDELINERRAEASQDH